MSRPMAMTAAELSSIIIAPVIRRRPGAAGVGSGSARREHAPDAVEEEGAQHEHPHPACDEPCRVLRGVHGLTNLERVTNHTVYGRLIERYHTVYGFVYGVITDGREARRLEARCQAGQAIQRQRPGSP